METFRVLLNASARRRARRDLIRIVEVVALYLQAGYDLAYAWPEAWKALGKGEAPRLETLAAEYPDPTHRLWFGVLVTLYREGAPLRDAFLAMAETLRAEHGRDLDTHWQRLPARLNVLILLFYFPAAALLLFTPLLLELLAAF